MALWKIFNLGEGIEFIKDNAPFTIWRKNQLAAVYPVELVSISPPTVKEGISFYGRGPTPITILAGEVVHFDSVMYAPNTYTFAQFWEDTRTLFTCCPNCCDENCDDFVYTPMLTIENYVANNLVVVQAGTLFTLTSVSNRNRLTVNIADIAVDNTCCAGTEKTTVIDVLYNAAPIGTISSNPGGNIVLPNGATVNVSANPAYGNITLTFPFPFPAAYTIELQIEYQYCNVTAPLTLTFVKV